MEFGKVRRFFTSFLSNFFRIMREKRPVVGSIKPMKRKANPCFHPFQNNRESFVHLGSKVYGKRRPSTWILFFAFSVVLHSWIPFQNFLFLGCKISPKLHLLYSVGLMRSSNHFCPTLEQEVYDRFAWRIIPGRSSYARIVFLKWLKEEGLSRFSLYFQNYYILLCFSSGPHLYSSGIYCSQ